MAGAPFELINGVLSRELDPDKVHRLSTVGAQRIRRGRNSLQIRQPLTRATFDRLCDWFDGDQPMLSVEIAQDLKEAAECVGADSFVHRIDEFLEREAEREATGYAELLKDNPVGLFEAVAAQGVPSEELVFTLLKKPDPKIAKSGEANRMIVNPVALPVILLADFSRFSQKGRDALLHLRRFREGALGFFTGWALSVQNARARSVLKDSERAARQRIETATQNFEVITQTLVKARVDSLKDVVDELEKQAQINDRRIRDLEESIRSEMEEFKAEKGKQSAVIEQLKKEVADLEEASTRVFSSEVDVSQLVSATTSDSIEKLRARLGKEEEKGKVQRSEILRLKACLLAKTIDDKVRHDQFLRDNQDRLEVGGAFSAKWGVDIQNVRGMAAFLREFEMCIENACGIRAAKATLRAFTPSSSRAGTRPSSSTPSRPSGGEGD